MNLLRPTELTCSYTRDTPCVFRFSSVAARLREMRCQPVDLKQATAVATDAPFLYLHPSAQAARPAPWQPRKQAQHLLLYLHGNAEDIGLAHRPMLAVQKHLESALPFTEWHVVVPELPGYGLLPPSSGSEQEFGAQHIALVRYVQLCHTIPFNHVWIWGFSVGCNFASRLAAAYAHTTTPLGGCVLLNGVATMEDLLRDRMGRFLSMSWRVFQKTGTTSLSPDNTHWVQRTTCAFLILSTAGDEVVSATHAQKLLQAANERPRLSADTTAVYAEVPGTHSVVDFRALITCITAFVAKRAGYVALTT